jgi:hypothetical protein
MKITISKLMKGKIACFLLILTGLITQKANAQVSYNLGLDVAPQLSFMSSNVGTYSSGIGFQGGITEELRFDDVFSLEWDAFYRESSVSRNYADSITGYYNVTKVFNISRTEQLTYFDGTVLFKFNIPLGYDRVVPYDRPGKRSFLSFFIGPYFGTNLSYSSTGSTDTTIYLKNRRDSGYVKSNDNTAYTKSTFASGHFGQNPILSTDVGITVGAGIYFLVGERGTFNIDIRYSHSFGSIDNMAYGTRQVQINGDPTTDQIVYNYAQAQLEALQLHIGYRWRLIGKGQNRNF